MTGNNSEARADAEVRLPRDEPDGGLAIRQDPATGRSYALLRVAGELDLATAAVFAQALTRLVEDGCRHVDLDLSDVTFCDSAGLKVLVDAHERLRRREGTLVVHEPCRSLRLLLDIFGLTTSLEPGTPTRTPSTAMSHLTRS